MDGVTVKAAARNELLEALTIRPATQSQGLNLHFLASVVDPSNLTVLVAFVS